MIKRQDVRDIFRDKLLDALDEASDAAFGMVVPVHRARGWTDADLPELFKTIDAQVERLAARFAIKLEEVE
jgi:hypothetical protein